MINLKPVLGNDTSYCGNFSKVLSNGSKTDRIEMAYLLKRQISTTVTQSGTYVGRVNNSCGTVSDTISISKLNALNVNLEGILLSVMEVPLH